MGFVVRVTMVVIVAGCLALGGCGSDNKLATAGRVVRGGQPLKIQDDEALAVTFYQLNADNTLGKNAFYAETNKADGTFKAAGPTGKGIPPGKYRIAVEHTKKRKDLLNGSFGSDKSPYVFDITADTPELVIDLAKKP